MSAKHTKKSKESFAYGKQLDESTGLNETGVIDLQLTKEGAIFSVLPSSDTSAILSGPVALSSPAAFTPAIEAAPDEANENLAELSIIEEPIGDIVNKNPIEASIDEDFAYKSLDS